MALTQPEAVTLAETIAERYPQWVTLPVHKFIGEQGWVVDCLYPSLGGHTMPVDSLEAFEQHHGRHDAAEK